jgi:hypothetical protein
VTDPKLQATFSVLASQRNEALDQVARMAGVIAVYEAELKALKQQLAAIEKAAANQEQTNAATSNSAGQG